jgi:putative chitinase
MIKFADIIKYSKALLHQVKFGEELDALLQNKGYLTIEDIQRLTPIWREPKNDSLITQEVANHVYEREVATELLEELRACCDRFKINTPVRLRHFLAHTGHESGGLQWLEEIASGADYEWREDLGNIYEGDGMRYKGAGVIQLTGRFNYQNFAEYMKDDRIMEGHEYVAKNYPFSSAGFWWENNGMNELCDRNPNDIRATTLRVNGGYNGLEDRERRFALAAEVL